MKIARFAARTVIGGLFIGHGTQKLFGWFGGPGLDGAAAGFDSMGLRPGRRNAIAAGAPRRVGGAALALGLATPARRRGADRHDDHRDPHRAPQERPVGLERRLRVQPGADRRRRRRSSRPAPGCLSLDRAARLEAARRLLGARRARGRRGRLRTRRSSSRSASRRRTAACASAAVDLLGREARDGLVARGDLLELARGITSSMPVEAVRARAPRRAASPARARSGGSAARSATSARAARRSYAASAASTLAVAGERVARARSASRIACDAPFEPIGYIGCAASPSSVTRPSLQRVERVAVGERVLVDRARRRRSARARRASRSASRRTASRNTLASTRRDQSCGGGVSPGTGELGDPVDQRRALGSATAREIG